VRRRLHGLTRPGLLVLALLVGTIGGVFTGAQPAGADTIYSNVWVGLNGSNYCDASTRHLPNLYGYPYAGTLSGISRACFATQTIVYWGPYAKDSGQGGAVTEVVGGSQGNPFQSAHLLCWAIFQCGSWYWIY
jgi:hypothetical protein